MSKIFVFLGSINAFLAVALGAFGAHLLKGRIALDLLEIYETGFKYHIVHALGLILIGILAGRMNSAVLPGWSGWLLFAGILLFSGSLYLMALSGQRWLGAVTPLGGIAFLAGWLLLAVATLKNL